jgi:tetratricopeptide (TPR) repeat protein
LKDYPNALIHYKKLKSEFPLPLEDLLYYSETNAFLGNYTNALEGYEQILATTPDDHLIQKKIWRLKNIQYLYEDSLHYTIRPLNINSEYSEMSPIPYGDGIVFLSDQKRFEVDDSQHEFFNSFLNFYYAESRPDTINSVSIGQFKKPQSFSKELLSDHQFGPISFYDNGSQCIFAAARETSAKDGSKKMQLYFATKREGKWRISNAFQHNNSDFEFTHPSITPDGRTLYFSSNMPGGLGGSDIYRSEFINESWTIPENLGEIINTRMDEVFPSIYLNTLSFSSNGHAGFGGLDIFSIILTDKIPSEVNNLGYPINSSADDFGIIFTSSSHGYLSSNRKNGGYDDDLFEFEMDFRTYPFSVSGTIKIKENNVVDTSAIAALPDAKIYLIDNIHQIKVSESQTDVNGNFALSIPWFSKYLLRIVTSEGHEHLASLEISKKLNYTGEYEIVVVKDLMASLGKR